MTQIGTPPGGKYFLKVKEAAQIIGVSVDWMQKLLAGKHGDDRPPFVRIGGNGHYRIRAQEFMDWIERQSESRWPQQGSK
jgi:excisionase family DNA binding protein